MCTILFPLLLLRSCVVAAGASVTWQLICCLRLPCAAKNPVFVVALSLSLLLVVCGWLRPTAVDVVVGVAGFAGIAGVVVDLVDVIDVIDAAVVSVVVLCRDS